MKVAILGTGQLARMLALAGQPLGLRFRFLQRGDAPPDLPGEVWSAGPDPVADPATDEGPALARFIEGADVVTFESEAWEAHALASAAGPTPLFPTPRALALSQDRLPQKEMFQRLGLESAPFARVDTPAALSGAVRSIGLPAVLKLRRGGYDGRGQWVLRVPRDVIRARRELAGRPAILEALVPFERELSILAVRGRDGARAFYPLVQNVHERGCLRLTLAPAPDLALPLQGRAEAMAGALLDELDYVGVLALELFERDGRLLANELAPRVHNSGHWTIEGAETSQFENHLRAITGLPLGSTRALGTSAMLNLLGSLPPVEQALAVPGAHLHVYGKTPAPGRKLGHVTLRARSPRELGRRLPELSRRLAIPLPDSCERWMAAGSLAST